MPAERFLRRGDDQLVEAMTYTGEDVDEVRAWLAGYRVTEQGRALFVTGHHEDGTLGVRPGHWVVRAGVEVSAVQAHEFFSRYRSPLVE